MATNVDPKTKVDVCILHEEKIQHLTKQRNELRRAMHELQLLAEDIMCRATVNDFERQINELHAEEILELIVTNKLD